MRDRKDSLPARAIDALTVAGQSYAVDRGSRMAAAISYRTIFALAPLLLIAVAIFGLVVGSSEEAQARIMESITRVLGEDLAASISVVLTPTGQSSGWVTVVGFVLFLWTASTLFQEVQNNLNDIFDVPYEQTSGIRGFIRKRGIGFLWVVGLGLLTIVVWLLNVVWGWIVSLVAPELDNIRELLNWLTPLVSLALFPVIFALCFRTMTEGQLKWRAIWAGSCFTAVVFVLTAIGSRIYFAWDQDTSAYQVAGGLFIILLLAYFLSAAFLMGAQVTKVINDRMTEPVSR